GLAFIAPYTDFHAEPAALQLAAPHRQYRAAQCEAGDDVGAAGDRGELQVGLDRAVDVIEAFRRQRRTGGEQRAQRGQVVGPAGLETEFGEAVDVLGRGAEDADFFLRDVIPQHRSPSDEGRAVVE